MNLEIAGLNFLLTYKGNKVNKKNQKPTMTPEESLDMLKSLGNCPEWDVYVKARTWQESILAFPELVKKHPDLLNYSDEILIKMNKETIDSGKMKITDFPIALRKDLI